MKRFFIILMLIINISVFCEISIPTSDNSKDCSMTIYNNYAYTVFSTSTNVYFSKGLLSGTTFSTVKVNSTSMDSIGKPDICINPTNGNVYIFWKGKTALDTYSKIYYSISTDNGNNFSIPAKLEPSGTADWNFSEVRVACTSTRIGVAAIGSNSSGTDIRVFYGNDTYGNIDGNDVKNITSNAAVWKTDLLENISTLNLTVSANGNFNVLIEREYNDTLDVFFRSYTDTDSNPSDISVIASASQNVSGQTAFRALPYLFSDGNNVYFAYQDISTGVNRLRVGKSSDFTNWEFLLLKGFSSGIKSVWPAIFKSDSEIYAIWDEGDSSSVNMKYKKIDFIESNQSEYSLVFESGNPQDLSKTEFTGGSDRVYYVYANKSLTQKSYFGQQYVAQGSSGSGQTMIKSRNPDANAINVSPSGGVRVEFSNPVNAVTSLMVSLKDQTGNVTFTVSNISDTVCVITPSSWKKNMVYTVSVSGVTDKSGNSVPPSEWQFTTSSTDSSSNSITKLINYPNPYKGGVFRFAYDFSQPADSVKIQIYNLKGRLIKSIRSTDLQGAGSEVIWDVTDKWGNSLGNGVYVYKIIAVINGRTVEKNGKFIVAI